MATPAARKAGPATAAAPQLTTCRWSSSDEADRVPVEDPATGEVIAVVQGATDSCASCVGCHVQIAS